MGLSVWNQVDSNKYFSISSIDKLILKQKGIDISLAEFKEIVRRAPPFTIITTGSDVITGRTRRTKIYRYEDFEYLKNKVAGGDAM